MGREDTMDFWKMKRVVKVLDTRFEEVKIVQTILEFCVKYIKIQDVATPIGQGVKVFSPNGYERGTKYGAMNVIEIRSGKVTINALREYVWQSDVRIQSEITDVAEAIENLY